MSMGMDSTSPLQAVKEGFVRRAWNCRPGLAGGWVKREGYSNFIDNAYGSRNITGGIEFSVSGSKRLVVFGTTGSGTGGRYGYNNAGTVSDITTGLSGTARPCFATFGSLLFFMNGADTPEVYNGTAARQVGITAPVSAPTGSQGTAGSLTQTGTYSYAYTYYNSVTGAESSPSPLYTVTLTGTNDDVTLTISAGSATTADTIRIYRTVNSGNVLFLEGTAAIGATSYASTIADTALSSTQLELDNTRITTWSSTPNYVQVVTQRIFCRTGNNEIRYSKIGQSGPMPESFEAKAFADTTGKFGAADDVVGIAVAGNVPIVLKEKSIGSLRPLGLAIPGAVDNVVYEYVEQAASVAPVGHHGATEVFGEAIILCRDNIYGTRGQQGDLRPVADPIQATIRALGFSSSQITKVSAVNDEKNRCIYFSVFTNSNATKASMILVGDYRLYPNFRWSVYVQGTNTSTHPGIEAACFIPVTNSTDGSRDILFGNFNLNGKTYKMNDGDDDDGYGIYWEIESRPYDMGSPINQKLFKDTFIYGAGSGGDYALTVSAKFDLSDSEENVTQLTLFTDGAPWDTAVFDSDNWATQAISPRKFSQHRKASYMAIVMRQTEANAPVTLHSWNTSGSIFGLF